MKVIYITHESFLDHSYTIIKELRKKCELKVFILAKVMSNELNEWCVKTGAEFIKRKRFRNPLSLFDSIKLMRRIKKIGSNKVWFNSLSIYQGILAKMMLRDFLVMVHDVEYHPESKDFHSFLSLWVVFKLLKKNICVASNTQAEIFLNKYGIKPKLFQLPIIDYYRGTRVSPGQNDINKKDTLVKFFFFGSVEPYKGIETLIEAAEILEKKKSLFKLNIYGKIKYTDSTLSNRISDLKNVSLYNEYIDYKEIHRIYSENDILVLPYRQVTQCGPLLIAYSEGTSVICNNLPGFREYVVADKSGLIYDGTALNLSEKLQEIIENKSKITEMREFIKTEIYNKFSMESLVDKYIDNLN
jgi:glycosyltransferase involved in cell wall biosynthesis